MTNSSDAGTSADPQSTVHNKQKQVEAALGLLDLDVWKFSSPKSGMLTATRGWTDDSVDTLLVLGAEETANGRRDDPAKGLVWQLKGAIGEVVAALNASPAPGKPGAPRESVRDRTDDPS